MSENEYGEQEGEEDDEIEYEVFYDIKDIKFTLERQEQNVFGDLINVVERLKVERIDPNPSALNKFNIQEWAPKAVEEENKQGAKRKRQIMNMEKSDEEDDESKDDQSMKEFKDEQQQDISDVNNSNIQGKQLQKLEEAMLKNEIEAMVGDLVTLIKPKSGAESKNGDKDTKVKKQGKGDADGAD